MKNTILKSILVRKGWRHPVEKINHYITEFAECTRIIIFVAPKIMRSVFEKFSPTLH